MGHTKSITKIVPELAGLYVRLWQGSDCPHHHLAQLRLVRWHDVEVYGLRTRHWVQSAKMRPTLCVVVYYPAMSPTRGKFPVLFESNSHSAMCRTIVPSGSAGAVPVIGLQSAVGEGLTRRFLQVFGGVFRPIHTVCMLPKGFRGPKPGRQA